MKQQLINGKHFHFNNENHCINTDNDDIRGAECWFNPVAGWLGGFKIEFNGSLIHSSKTFVAFKKRLDKLISDWHLELIDITD